MTLLQNATAVRAGGVPTAFGASGGLAPYFYEVLPGGAGGTITADGIYTSGPLPGIDSVRATDINGQKVTAQIKVCGYFELLCDIIQHELGLADGRVWVYNQKIMEPKDFALYIVVDQVSAKSFGTSNVLVDGVSQQALNMMAMLQIDIKSRGPEALYRKEEVVLALSSDYAERSQQLNSFKISRLATAITNLSSEDGAAIPYRFNLGVNLTYAFTKATAAPYYDKFSGFSVVPNA